MNIIFGAEPRRGAAAACDVTEWKTEGLVRRNEIENKKCGARTHTHTHARTLCANIAGCRCIYCMYGMASVEAIKLSYTE